MMRRVQVGFVAKRTEDGGFVEDRPILREVSDSELGASGLTKVEERALRRAANSVFAELAKDNPLFAK
jgi:hypothetical protein